MKPHSVRFFLCLSLFASTGCKKNSERDQVEALEREVRSLKLELGASAELRASELAQSRIDREQLGTETDWKISDLERELSQANAQLERYRELYGPAVASSIKEQQVAKAAESDANETKRGKSTPFGSANPSESGDSRSNTASSAPSRLSTEAVMLIVGDQSQGTGFMVRDGNKYFLYTAAHVLSGNSRLTVTNSEGRKFTKFGDLQAAEGIDLVRLQLFEDDPGAYLQVAGPESQVEVDTEIAVLGNGGGAGVIAVESGNILGISSDTLELDAEIIQGDSGGPVVIKSTGRVAGLATHLTAKREDIWSEGTRFSDVRRFACRLDRSWRWTQIPLTTFLDQAKEVAEYDRMTRVAFAISSLNPTTEGLRLDIRLSENQTAFQLLSEATDIPIVAQIIEMNTNLGNRRMRTSEADLQRKFRSMLSTAAAQFARQGADFDPTHMSWYHRNTAQDSVEWRQKAIAAIKSRYESLSN